MLIVIKPIVSNILYFSYNIPIYLISYNNIGENIFTMFHICKENTYVACGNTRRLIAV